MSRAFVYTSDGKLVTIEAPDVANRVLNDFLIDNQARIDALLQPLGLKLESFIQPEWKMIATIADLQIHGSVEDTRSGLAEQIGRLTERAAREAQWAALKRASAMSVDEFMARTAAESAR